MADKRNEYTVGENNDRRPPRRGPGHGPGAPAEKARDFKGTWLKLARYIGSNLIYVVIAEVSILLGTVCTLIGPQKLSEITELIKGGLLTGIDLDAVYAIAVTLAVIYGLGYVFNLTEGVVLNEVVQRVSKRLRTDISAKLDRLPMSYFGTATTGDILSRVTNDVDTITQSLNSSISTLVMAVTMFVGSLFMMLKTDLIMTLAAILSSLLGFAGMSLIMGRSQKYFLRQQRALGALNAHIEEIYAGHTVVQAYNAEAQATAEFERLNGELRNSALRAQFLSGLMPPLMGFIGNLGYVAVCVTGAVLTMNGRIGFGTIVAFMFYVRYFTQPLNQIAQAMQSMQSGAAAGERVFEFLEAEEMSDESAKPAHGERSRGAVEFDRVHFGYDVGKPIIHSFSASAKPGQKIAIVGPTGAGKTTLVNLLMRFYELWGGEIRIDGTSISDMRREDVHAQFCMVLQDTWLFEGTVRENLVYCKQGVTDEQLERACRAVGIARFIHTLPQGYDTVLGDKVSLSAGQKQQLTIARAMIQDAPMLILDEATSSVDTRTELQIQRAMDELMRERTSFVIAHRLSTIKNADLILVLRDGDVVESGTHEQLLAQNGFYAELYNSQFEQSA